MTDGAHRASAIREGLATFTDMRVGLSVASIHADAADGDVSGWVIDRVRAAAAAGLHTLSIGDHHATGPAPYVQNVPMLGRLLAEWDDRPAGLLFLVPAWNPVLMAEQIGTLAAIASGPFIVQTGLGAPRQIEALGVTVDHRGRRFEENVLIAQALLAGERVTDVTRGLRDVAIAPRPPRGVEWWIGASADAAIDRAARIGDGWYADAGIDAAQAETQMRAYLAACERHDREPGRLVIRRDVFISDDDAHATAVGQGLIDAGYRGGLREGAVAFGGVERVVEQLSLYADLGFDEVVIRTMAGIPQREAVRSIELAGVLADRLAG